MSTFTAKLSTNFLHEFFLCLTLHRRKFHYKEIMMEIPNFANLHLQIILKTISFHNNKIKKEFHSPIQLEKKKICSKVVKISLSRKQSNKE